MASQELLVKLARPKTRDFTPNCSGLVPGNPFFVKGIPGCIWSKFKIRNHLGVIMCSDGSCNLPWSIEVNLMVFTWNKRWIHSITPFQVYRRVETTHRRNPWCGQPTISGYSWRLVQNQGSLIWFDDSSLTKLHEIMDSSHRKLPIPLATRIT